MPHVPQQHPSTLGVKQDNSASNWLIPYFVSQRFLFSGTAKALLVERAVLRTKGAELHYISRFLVTGRPQHGPPWSLGIKGGSKGVPSDVNVSNHLPTFPLVSDAFSSVLRAVSGQSGPRPSASSPKREDLHSVLPHRIPSRRVY